MWKWHHITLLLAIFGLSGVPVPVQAQLVLNQMQPPTTLVQNVLMGPGVFATNVTFNGSPGNVLAPSGGTSTLGEIGRFNGSNTCLGLPAGVFLCTGNASYILPGPNNQLLQYTGGVGGAGFFTSPDIDISHLSAWPNWQVSGGNNVGNKSVLEFDFVPTSDMISVRYVFSSEEYERWACSQYNDAFGFFISGPGIPTNINGPYSNNSMNLAFIPGTLSRVSINTVNSGLMDASNANGPDYFDPFAPCFAADPNWQANSIYYRYNGGQWPSTQPGGGAAQLEAPYSTDPYYIQANGMTVVLTASAAVECGQMYHIKLGVGNVADNWFPSAVWLEQGSFTSSNRFKLTVDAGPNVEYHPTDTTFIENDCDSVYLRFHRLGGFYLDEWLQISTGGTATNGVDVVPALIDSVHFNQLDSFAIVPVKVPVDADGLENLIVNIITCNGTHVQTYDFPIDQRPPLTVDLADTTLTCPAEVTLTPTVTGGGNDPAEYTYLWSTGETTPSITAFVDETSQFWVQVKDCWTEPVTDSAWVFLPNYVPMELTLTPDTAIPCLGNADLTVSAQHGSGGYTYAWTLAGQLQGTDTVLNVPAAQPSVYYVVTVTDLCGIQVSDSVLVGWAPAAPLVLTLTPDTAIPCLGHADLIASVTGGGGILQYTWTHNGDVVGTDSVLNVPAAVQEIYTVEVSDQCGQSVQGQVVVTTGPTPPLNITAVGDTVMCAGMPMVLSVISVSGGGGAYSYAWSPGGTGPSNGQNLTVHVDNDMAFTVTVTDQCGNQADTTLMAVVTDHPPLEIEVPNDTLVCPGQVVPLWVAIYGGAGNYVVNWPGVGSGPQVNWTAGHHGRNITVEVTDACGSTAMASVDVSTYPASASIDGEELTEGTWRFEGDVVPPFGNTVNWTFGDGGTATGLLNVTHTYQDYNAYWVVLQIITPDGCVAVDSIRTRPPAATVYFPNSFTPDGDGINDTFGGDGLLISTYELWIFNRWGQVVFESQDIHDRWNGRTSNGEEVPQGIYQYKYIVEGLSMPKRQGFGHVTLLR